MRGLGGSNEGAGQLHPHYGGRSLARQAEMGGKWKICQFCGLVVGVSRQSESERTYFMEEEVR